MGTTSNKSTKPFRRPKNGQEAIVSTGRDGSGKFADGNLGGPGRPRRAIEREYLATLGEAVTLNDWREVVARAVTDAKAGDAPARAWLAKYLVGDKPSALLDLAAAEADGRTAEVVVGEHIAELRYRVVLHGVQRERIAKLNRIFDKLEG